MAKNSYMITNRATPNATQWEQIVPLSGQSVASLWWYLAQSPYDPNVADYEPQSSNPGTTPPSSFINALVNDLKTQSSPKLAVYIHGLGNVWSDAVQETAELGQWLASQGGYTGLVMGFSWPSYSEFWSAAEYGSLPYSFPPQKLSGTIRDNISGSRKSFGSLMSFLENMTAAVPGLSLSIICHSEGNYMLMVGMYQLTCVMVSQVLLLAADINNAALQIPASGLIGQGSYIAGNANRVTVYYSPNDPTLSTSVASFGPALLHNPVYGGRLGLIGPSYNYGQQQPQCVGVDCSVVVNEQNVQNLERQGIIPPLTDLHSSYRYIPQVLQDLTQTLNGVGSGQISGRKAITNPASYLMQLTSS